MKNGPKLNVGLVFDDSLDSNDGVAQYVKTLGAWLSDQGHSVQYLVGETQMSTWQSGKVHSLATNLNVRFNGNRLSMPLLARKPGLKKVLTDADFDVLHVMTPYSPLMGGRLIVLASPNTAIVGTFHILPAGKLSRVGSKLLAGVLSRSLKRFNGFASVSRPAQDYARQAYGIESVIIPNPVDIKKFQVKEYNHQKRIVFLGRLVKRKGCRQLIEAFAKIAHLEPDYELIIAGDGPERKSMQALVQQRHLENRVKFLGRISETDKPELLSSATIACFPSLYGESFGIVLIEAMAAGAEVVLGGDNPGYRSVLGQRPELLFNPKNHDELATKILELINDPAARKKISSWQHQSVKQYDIPVVGAQIVELYRRAIAKKRSARHN